MPGTICQAWLTGRFDLITCRAQLQELRLTLQKPAIATRIQPHRAGRIINELSVHAEVLASLPFVQRSPDPEDDFLLAAVQASSANYLVTGDKSGLLSLKTHKGTKIITARRFADLLA